MFSAGQCGVRPRSSSISHTSSATPPSQGTGTSSCVGHAGHHLTGALIYTSHTRAGSDAQEATLQTIKTQTPCKRPVPQYSTNTPQKALARAAAIVALEINRNRLGEFIEIANILLCKCLTSNDCQHLLVTSQSGLFFECIPSNACSTLMASFALVSKYGMPPFDWQKVMARFEEIW